MSAIAAVYNLECWQLDYNAAFLNAEAIEGVYVKMVPKNKEFDETNVSMSIRLRKSIYGLRQSTSTYGRYRRLSGEDLFEKLNLNPCVYANGDVIIIWTSYVADVSLLGKYKEILERVEQKLMSYF